MNIKRPSYGNMPPMDNIELSLFTCRISAVCEEMGAILQRAAFSPNIKDRLDYSCAIFDAQGSLCAQAAHIPVHLGSMAYAMKAIVGAADWSNGDMLILNDPYLGGTHLPDVTLIGPIFQNELLLGFVANRAHHADIGATSPGSMPISASLDDEGLLIPPTMLMQKGKLNTTLKATLLNGVSNTVQSEGDFSAQISANQLGLQRVKGLIQKMGVQPYLQALNELNHYGERLAKAALSAIPDGEYAFTDVMDDDGMGAENISIRVNILISGGEVSVDFSGTADQVNGNINCPLSVAVAGVYYVFRCLMPTNTPACEGSFRHIHVTAPQGSLLNANRPAAVAAGNVETSTRVVDVIMGALAKAIPNQMAAASQGSMNNIAMGAREPGNTWDYYETVGGGMGASVKADGLSGVQTHMTNTLNTPIESLEIHYPLRVTRYALREQSGGAGLHHGGAGLWREFEFLANADVTLLTERRYNRPWGLLGGDGAALGENMFNGQPVPAKTTFKATKGDKLSVKTPGGGGFGIKNGVS